MKFLFKNTYTSKDFQKIVDEKDMEFKINENKIDLSIDKIVEEIVQEKLINTQLREKKKLSDTEILWAFDIFNDNSNEDSSWGTYDCLFITLDFKKDFGLIEYICE
jgi:hypothetical protein